MAEPTILIKKADGTTVRVPLSSIRTGVQPVEMHTNIDEQPPVSPVSMDSTVSMPDVEAEPPMSVQEAEPKKTIDASSKKRVSRKSDIQPLTETVPVPVSVEEKTVIENTNTNAGHELTVSSSHVVATSTPVDDYFVDIAKAKSWKQTDVVSLLDTSAEDVQKQNKNVPSVLPQKRYDDVEHVVAALPFSFPEAFHPRLHALIQSRIKEIRTDHQVVSYATRSAEEGGLGITEEEAQTLVDVIQRVLMTRTQPSIPAPKQTVRPIGMPHLVTPHQDRTSDRHSSVQSATTVPKNKGDRLTLQDIEPPSVPAMSGTMGPIDEIETMEFSDFRRLSQNPEEAMAIVLKKVQVLRDESYLEYVKAKSAWKKSPLYMLYLSYLTDAVRQKKRIQELIKDDMTEEDIIAIACISSSFRLS